jgi:hypothetical protein
MSKKPKEHTKHTATTEFEVDGIEEAYEPSPERLAPPPRPGQGGYKPKDLPKLQVETPPELQEPFEHTAKIWILDRRTRGWIARIKRWFVGKARK